MPVGINGGRGPSLSKRAPITVAKQMAFLRAYARGPTAGRLKASADLAGIAPTAHYHWLDHDPVYPELFKKARRISVYCLEDAVMERGVEGVLKPVGFHQGVPGAYVREYSDVLLLSALGARAPELGYNYRMNKVEVSGPNGGPIEISAQPIPLHKLSLDAQKQILEILEKELGGDSEELKALNPAPVEVGADKNTDAVDTMSDLDAIFGADLEHESDGRVSRDIWDIQDLMFLA